MVPLERRGGLSRFVRRTQLALLAASFVFALALGEIVVRAAGLTVPPRGEANTLRLCRPVDPEDVWGLAFRMVPGRSKTIHYPGEGDAGFDVPYFVNPDGFRDVRYARVPTPRTIRICALGDSFTFGTGVRAEETWPKALERLLRARGHDVEVMNCGVYNYNTRQEVSLLEASVLEFDPDIVLLCAYLNDASGLDRGLTRQERAALPDVSAPGSTGWETGWIERLGLTSGVWEPGEERTGAQRRMMALRRRSSLADLVAHRLHGVLAARATRANYASDWAEGSPGAAMVRTELARAAGLAEEHGFELHATMFPDLNGLDAPPFEPEHARFEGMVRELGLPYHDLLPTFTGLDGGELQVHAHDEHPNGAAHALAAAALADALEPRLGGALLTARTR